MRTESKREREKRKWKWNECETITRKRFISRCRMIRHANDDNDSKQQRERHRKFSSWEKSFMKRERERERKVLNCWWAWWRCHGKFIFLWQKFDSLFCRREQVVEFNFHFVVVVRFAFNMMRSLPSDAVTPPPHHFNDTCVMATRSWEEEAQPSVHLIPFSSLVNDHLL